MWEREEERSRKLKKYKAIWKEARALGTGSQLEILGSDADTIMRREGSVICFLTLIFIFPHCLWSVFIRNELSSVIWPLSKGCLVYATGFFLLWRVPFLRASSQLWWLGSCSLFSLLLLCSTNNRLPSPRFPGLLAWNPLLIWFGSGAAAASSPRTLWSLAWWRMVLRHMVFAHGFSCNMVLRFFSGSFFRALRWNFLCDAGRALGLSGLSKILLRSALRILCMGRLQLLLRVAALHWVLTDHLTCGKHVQSKCRNSPRAHQEQFRNVQFAYRVMPGMFLKALMMLLLVNQIPCGSWEWSSCDIFGKLIF